VWQIVTTGSEFILSRKAQKALVDRAPPGPTWRAYSSPDTLAGFEGPLGGREGQKGEGGKGSSPVPPISESTTGHGFIGKHVSRLYGPIGCNQRSTWVGPIHMLGWVEFFGNLWVGLGSINTMMGWVQRLLTYICSRSKVEDFAFYTNNINLITQI